MITHWISESGLCRRLCERVERDVDDRRVEDRHDRPEHHDDRDPPDPRVDPVVGRGRRAHVQPPGRVVERRAPSRARNGSTDAKAPKYWVPSHQTMLRRSPRRLERIGGAGGLVMIGLGVRLALGGRGDRPHAAQSDRRRAAEARAAIRYLRWRCVRTVTPVPSATRARSRPAVAPFLAPACERDRADWASAHRSARGARGARGTRRARGLRTHEALRPQARARQRVALGGGRRVGGDHRRERRRQEHPAGHLRGPDPPGRGELCESAAASATARSSRASSTC